jgi:hypothetical protein
MRLYLASHDRGPYFNLDVPYDGGFRRENVGAFERPALLRFALEVAGPGVSALVEAEQ